MSKRPLNVSFGNLVEESPRKLSIPNDYSLELLNSPAFPLLHDVFSEAMSSPPSPTTMSLQEDVEEKQTMPPTLICKEIEPKDVKLNVLHLKRNTKHIRVLLVRHGQSQANADKTMLQTHADHSILLSSQGEEQAKAAGYYIKNFYNEMNKRLWERIEKEKLSFVDISKQNYQHKVSYVCNTNTDFSFDNSLSDEDDDKSENNAPIITYPLRVRMWNSSYKRARQTAEIIMSQAGHVIQDQRESILLVEQQFGLFEGVPLQELQGKFPDEFNHFEKHIGLFGRFYARPPLGESRSKLFCEEVIADSEKYNINDVVIVAHGVTVRALTQMWINLSPEWFDNEINPHNCSIRLLDGSRDRGYLFHGFK